MSAHQKWAADLAKIRGVLTAEQQTTRALAEAAGLTIPRTHELLRNLNYDGAVEREMVGPGYQWRLRGEHE